MSDRTQYTFTFPKADETRFKKIMDRLDPEEFTIDEPIQPVDLENPKHSELKTVMTMEPEAASTFRFGMKELKIRRYRTEEELAAEKEKEEKNKIKVTVYTGQQE